MDISAVMAAELEALVKRTPTITITLPIIDAWCLMSELQLALRHPRNTGAAADSARRVKNMLIELIATTPALAAVAKMGDDPSCDA